MGAGSWSFVEAVDKLEEKKCCFICQGSNLCVPLCAEMFGLLADTQADAGGGAWRPNMSDGGIPVGFCFVMRGCTHTWLQLCMSSLCCMFCCFLWKCVMEKAMEKTK